MKYRVVGALGNTEIVEFTASGTISAGDLVTIDTGEARITGVGEPIKGVALNSVVATERVSVITGDRLRLYGTGSTTVPATAVGAMGDITVTTQTLNVTTLLGDGDGTDTGQLIVLEVNPVGYGNDSAVTKAIVEVVEKQ